MCRKGKSKAGVFNRRTGTGWTHNEVWSEHRVEGSESHADMQRQAEGTGRAEALGWTMPGTSEEQEEAGVAGLKEEEKKSQSKQGQVSQSHDHHYIGYGLLPNKTMGPSFWICKGSVICLLV